MIRVLICDDHFIVRQGLRQMLADADDMQVVAEAENGPDAVRRVREAVGGVDVVLMDIAMPHRDGLDVLRQLKGEFPRLPVLMLSTYPDKQYAVRSLKLGAAGYLGKGADPATMLAAIRKVAAGGLFVTAAVAEQLASAIGDRRSRARRRRTARATVAPRIPGLLPARRRPQRRRDRRRAGAVAEYRQHVPHAHPREDWRPQRCRAGALRNAGRLVAAVTRKHV